MRKYTAVLANGLMPLTLRDEKLRKIGSREIDIHFLNTNRDAEPIRTATVEAELVTGTVDDIVAAFREQLERQVMLLETMPDACQVWGGTKESSINCRIR